MAKISNTIEEYIRQLLNEANGQVEIQRNMLAEQFECAPSQINYVLTTRFTPYKGYYVDSRRGGGGYIRIVKVKIEEGKDALRMFQEEVGDTITKNRADDILEALEEADLITKDELKLLKIVLSDRSLNIAQEYRNNLRANILQNLILGILS